MTGACEGIDIGIVLWQVFESNRIESNRCDCNANLSLRLDASRKTDEDEHPSEEEAANQLPPETTHVVETVADFQHAIAAKSKIELM